MQDQERPPGALGVCLNQLRRRDVSHNAANRRTHFRIKRWTTSLLALCVVGAAPGALAQPVPGGTLDPTTIPKYVTPLVIPPVLLDDLGGTSAINAEVTLKQISQQVLPTSGCPGSGASCSGNAFPMTPLWAYGTPAKGFNNPAFTIEVTQNVGSTIKWINGLVDGAGNYLPHIIKDKNGKPVVDQTLHWAAPNQQCLDGVARTDCQGASSDPYTGPIPMVVHVHGAHVGPGSDGYPEAWWLPAANNIDCTNVDTDDTPATEDDFDCNGTFFESAEGADTDKALGQGYAIDLYTNDQPTATLWYHDHALGMTRLNVYAAGAGFYMVRTATDGETGILSGTLPGPPARASDTLAALNTPGDPVRNAVREIPIAIQPKSFNADGTQFYPADRAFFEGLGDGDTLADNTDLNIPFLPQGTSDIAPIWNPEAFFNTMVVNGTTWPELDVAAEQYRFRFVNASDSRFLNLSLVVVESSDPKLVGKELPFYQIGSEQGLLPEVVEIKTGFASAVPVGTPTPLANRYLVRGTFKEQALLMGPAERPDVIVDFGGLPVGTKVRMVNTAPDAPFGGFPDVPADPATTGQVMQFEVTRAAGSDAGANPGTPVSLLKLDNKNPGGEPKLKGKPTATRDLALLEEESLQICVSVLPNGTINQVPGSLPPLCDLGGVPFAPKAAVLGNNGSLGGTVQLWSDPIAQTPTLDTTGNGEIWELWNWSADAHPIHLHLVKFQVQDRQVIGTRKVRGPEPWETGWKDTVIAYPGEVTRIRARFDVPGLYVWHCHILSHEDNEMMVPYCVCTNPANCAADCPSDLL